MVTSMLGSCPNIHQQTWFLLKRWTGGPIGLASHFFFQNCYMFFTCIFRLSFRYSDTFLHFSFFRLLTVDFLIFTGTQRWKSQTSPFFPNIFEPVFKGCLPGSLQMKQHTIKRICCCNRGGIQLFER